MYLQMDCQPGPSAHQTRSIADTKYVAKNTIVITIPITKVFIVASLCYKTLGRLMACAVPNAKPCGFCGFRCLCRRTFKAVTGAIN